MNKRLFIVFLLGFSSGLPLALITSTLQAWFADTGMSIVTTGMLSLLGLPYIYRMVLAPFLDRYPLFSLGRRRSWMLVTQLGLLAGFNSLAWFSPNNAPHSMMMIAFLLACLSALQDTAVDAHRTEFLPSSEHALGASLAIFGYRLGLLLAGGFALILADKVGWAITYRVMGTLMIVGVIASCMPIEPAQKKAPAQSFLLTFVLPVQELLSRNGMIPLVLFVLFYKAGEAFTTTTSGIVMPFLIQGLGFSLESIGYVNKLLGVAAILIGGLTSGLLLLRWQLYRALLIFGLLQVITNMLFVALALSGKNFPLFALAVAADNFVAGMASTALVALFMRLVNQQYTATQFSLLVAIASLPRVFSGPIAAFLQMHLGWVGLYQLSVVIAIMFVPFLMMIKKHMGIQESKVPKNYLNLPENTVIKPR